MRKMKNTGLTKKELKDRIRSLMEDLASLKEGMDEVMSREDFLTFLEEMIDTFSEGIEAADAIRVICLEGDDSGVISSLDGSLSATVLPDVAGQEPDPSAVLSFGSDDIRVLPFPHIHRICPWLNDRSVMRSVPGAKDVYYLFEEGSQVRVGRDFFLVGPVVMIKLNDDHFLESPNALDLHRVRKFLKDNTRSVVFEEGAAYPALHFV